MRTTSQALVVLTALAISGGSARADNRECWNELDFGREVHAYRPADAGSYTEQKKNARVHTVVKWNILTAMLGQAGGGAFFDGRPVYYIEPFAGYGMEAVEIWKADAAASMGVRAHEGSYLHALRALRGLGAAPSTVRMSLNFGAPGDGFLTLRYRQAFNASCLLSRGNVSAPRVASFFPAFVPFDDVAANAWRNISKIPGVTSVFAGDNPDHVIRVIYIDPYGHQLSRPAEIRDLIDGAEATGHPYIFIVNTLLVHDAREHGVTWDWLAGYNRDTDLLNTPDSHRLRVRKAWRALRAVVLGENRTRWNNAYAFYKYDAARGPVFVTSMFCVNADAVCARGAIDLPDHVTVTALDNAQDGDDRARTVTINALGLDADNVEHPLQEAVTSMPVVNVPGPYGAP